jgi:hypothetical protein
MVNVHHVISMLDVDILPAPLFILNRIDIHFFILVILLMLCLAAALHVCLTVIIIIILFLDQ